MRLYRTMAVLLAGTALTITAAAAQEVGTATAVNPLTQSAHPGASSETLNVGSRIVHNERIHTTPTGSAQLLFTDHSTMSISANADIVIDDYVYDPNSGNGHMLATLGKGALRYVGGKLSHQGEATIETPVATIGIRGAVATITQVGGGWQVTDDYGVLTIANNAGTTVLKRPGFSVLVANRNTPPTLPVRVTASQTGQHIEALSSHPGQDGGVPGLKAVRVGSCGTGPVQGSAGAAEGAVCPDKPWINTDTGASDAFGIIQQANEHATNRFPIPQPRIRGR